MADRWDDSLRVAVQVLTRLPVAAPHLPLARAAPAFPVVGLGIGLAGASVFWVVSLGLPPVLAALASTAVTLLLTGALHEDGLADSADGLLGGRTIETRLAIMRDSRIGSFGALALLVVAGAKIACLSVLPNPEAAIVAAHASSRFWMLLPAAALPYARAEGLAGRLHAPGMAAMAGAAAVGLLPLLLLGGRAAPALLVSGAAAAAMLIALRRRLGGYTGDTLGATQQVTELAVLAAALWHAA